MVWWFSNYCRWVHLLRSNSDLLLLISVTKDSESRWVAYTSLIPLTTDTLKAAHILHAFSIVILGILDKINLRKIFGMLNVCWQKFSHSIKLCELFNDICCLVHAYPARLLCLRHVDWKNKDFQLWHLFDAGINGHQHKECFCLSGRNIRKNFFHTFGVNSACRGVYHALLK